MTGPFLRLAGPERAVELFGVKLLGFTAENGTKLLLTLAAAVVLWGVGLLLRSVMRLFLRNREDARAQFWSQQAVQLATTLLFLVAFVSIWFSDPGRLTTAFGLVSAGLAFALQRVITAVAGYFVILRGRLFNVGDRITMGGVRGDVIALGYVRTTVMEMGEPASVQKADPAMWVEARQYTGRIVTITNDKVFDEPIYNYTREFPYLWEEMHVPIQYTADRARAERILLDAARRHTIPIAELSEPVLAELRRRYFVSQAGLEPRVYLRLTDNWLELTVRFIARDHGIRELKDAMSREVLDALDEAGIGVASATYEIVGLPPLRIQRDRADPGNRPPRSTP